MLHCLAASRLATHSASCANFETSGSEGDKINNTRRPIVNRLQGRGDDTATSKVPVMQY
jgi:hypothetical protein